MRNASQSHQLILLLAMVLLCAGTVVTTTAQTYDFEDELITEAVDDALIDDQGVPAGYIEVKTNEGIVTLGGGVSNILAKERAEKVAATVKGVRGIINRIQVNVPHKPDNAIAEDVQYALLTDPVTDTYEVESVVRGNEVTLRGTVDSWQEREIAATVVKGVSGVKEVHNEITIDERLDRSDPEIRKEVDAVLKWDVYVDDGLIDVTVDDADVKLSGVVGSLAEKRRARVDAQVAGVETVDVDDLEIKFWRRDERMRKDKYVNVSEDAIRNAVESAFLYDPRVNNFDIHVKVDGGRVTLRGLVDNLKAKRAAAADARGIVGVWAVNNRIKVRPNTPTDRKIRRNIQRALGNNPYTERYDITINVVDGQVYLWGEVDSTFEKSQADDIASRHVGVTQVKNYLIVNTPDMESYDPYLDDWYLNDYEWYAQPDVRPRKTDWQLAEDVRIQLYWSPYVNRENVRVEVEDGRVTLSGKVATWAQRQAATQNAREAGAAVVDNNLLVEHGPTFYQEGGQQPPQNRQPGQNEQPEGERQQPRNQQNDQ